MRCTSTIPLLLAALLAVSARASGETLESTYFFSLADGAGTIPMRWPSLTWDPSHSELYAVDGNAGVIKVFNDAGMAIFTFGDDGEFGIPSRVAPTETGELFVVSYDGPAWTLVRYSARGEPLAKVALRGVPGGALRGFSPTALEYADGNLFLADTRAMRVIVLEPDGSYVRDVDLRPIVGGDPQQGGIRGFSVGPDGSLLFTVPTAFQAFIVAPDGSVRAFGQRGSTPGKFNIAAGIAADEDGRVYVTDSLRGVVIVFDRELELIGELGTDGSLVVPFDLVVGSNCVFVAQSHGGVKAFGIRFE